MRLQCPVDVLAELNLQMERVVYFIAKRCASSVEGPLDILRMTTKTFIHLSVPGLLWRGASRASVSRGHTALTWPRVKSPRVSLALLGLGGVAGVAVITQAVDSIPEIRGYPARGAPFCLTSLPAVREKRKEQYIHMYI